MPSNEANDREFRTMTPMQPEPLANSICIRREDPLVVPPQNSDRRIAIRVSDWRRIKANLSRAAEPTPDFSGVYCALFGFSGSALLSPIPRALPGGRADPGLFRSLLCPLRLLWISPLIRDRNRSGARSPRLGGAAACLPYRF